MQLIQGFWLRLIIISGVLLLASACTSENDNTDQTAQAETPTIGMVIAIPEEFAPLAESFVVTPLKAQMTARGYIEGETINYRIEISDDPDESEQSIQQLIEDGVDIFYAIRSEEVAAIRELAPEQPAVFIINEVGLSADIVSELDSEETNLTGAIIPFYHERRLELLLELAPNTTNVYFPYNPDNAVSAAVIEALEARVAQLPNVEITTVTFTDRDSARRAIENIPDNVDAIYLNSETEVTFLLDQWTQVSIEKQLPLSVPLFITTVPEILLGHGIDQNASNAIIARLIDAILQGTPIRELPAEPIDPSISISLPAARALGLEVSAELIEQASHVYRDEDFIVVQASAGQTAGFCNATIESLLGTNQVCVNQACDTIADTALLTFVNKADTEACATEGIVGVCTTDANATTFYDGEGSTLEPACLALGGEWTATNEEES